MPDQISIYCDGGSRSNPGPAACAFVVIDSAGRTLHEHGTYLGPATNNQAEYQAVIEALHWLLDNCATVPLCNFYLDSQLVVNQIIGLWRIKDSILLQKHLEIKKQIKNFPQSTFHFVNIPRSRNSRADLLVNTTLDNRIVK